MFLRKRLLLIGVIAVCALALLIGGSGYYLAKQRTTNGIASDIAATYRGGQVSEAEYQKQFDFQRKLIVPTYEENQQTRAEFLQEYITLHKVMIAQAKQAGIRVDLSQLDQQVQQYKDQVTQLAYNGNQQKFQAALNQYGITDEDIRTEVIDDAYLRQYRDLKVGHLQVSDAEVHTYYNSHQDVFAHGTVAQILVPTQAEAQQVKQRLQRGEDFAKVAKQVSTDPTAKQNGGILADVSFDKFDPEFQQVASQLKIGVLSDPMHTSYGWNIIRVDKRVIPAFANVKQDVQAKALADKQNNVWDQFYAQVQQQAQIQVQK